MSTCSPVTLRTTSGPVTKIRPLSLITTMSVNAGPYAAPPAAGPRPTGIYGTRPDARGTGHEAPAVGTQQDDDGQGRPVLRTTGRRTQDNRDLRYPPGRPSQRRQLPPRPVQRCPPLGQPSPAGVPQPEDGDPFPDR